MKRFIATIFFILVTAYSGYCQQLDTLRVLVLSPYKIDVCKECITEYAKRNSLLIKNRALAASAKREEKQMNSEQYNQQPKYTRIMFENDTDFIDSLNLSNYVSYMSREFIAYRLYKPYKIKPRLVLVTTEKVTPSLKDYATKQARSKADFIVNFPSIIVKNSKQGIEVKTVTELYSSKLKMTIIKSEGTGTIAGSGTADYPMCEQGTLECAFVNSVYESIYKCILAIAESRK